MAPPAARRNVGPPGRPDEESADDERDRGPGPQEGGPGVPPTGPDPGPEPGAPELPPRMRRFFRRGLLLYPVVVAVLWLGTDLGGWDALFLAALLELLPVLAVAQVPLAAGQSVDRPSAYVGSAGAILFLGWVSLILGRREVGLEAMGLTAISWTELLAWTAATFLASMILVGLFHALQELLGREESPFLRQIVPRTGFEKSLFGGVSLAAGLGEELAYRGYAIPVLAALIGSGWSAAVLSSGVFGFLHAYQGELGVVRTGLVGFVLAAAFLLSGSLWPAIAAHALIDLVGGLVIGPRLLDLEE